MIDTTKKYGRVKIIRAVEPVKYKTGVNAGRIKTWLCDCVCDCGKLFRTRYCSLAEGHTKSCGCWNTEQRIALKSRHKRHNTTEWWAWVQMRQRCKSDYPPIKRCYKDRGITVCERWETFENFFEDMGLKPHPKMSLDRIDNDKGYYPGNCRWATQKQQTRNSRYAVKLPHNGVVRTLMEWAEITGIGAATLRQRLNKMKWSVEKALTTPTISKFRPGRQITPDQAG